MAETAKTGTRFRHGLPILFEDSRVRVYKNPTNDIFVEDIRSCVTMRIRSHQYLGGGLTFTTNTGARVEPVLTNNMIGWRVSPH